MRTLLAGLLGLTLVACGGPDLVEAPHNVADVLLYDQEAAELAYSFVPRGVDSLYVQVEACADDHFGPGRLLVWGDGDRPSLDEAVPFCGDGTLFRQFWVSAPVTQSLLVEAEAVYWEEDTLLDVSVQVLGW